MIDLNEIHSLTDFQGNTKEWESRDCNAGRIFISEGAQANRAPGSIGCVRRESMRQLFCIDSMDGCVNISSSLELRREHRPADR
jgi:hypothetical protein